MADGLDVKISGIADLKASVEALIGSMQKKVVRGALRDAARIIQRGAQQRAPVLARPKRGRLPGVLKRSIKVFSSKQKNGRGGVIGVYIKPRGDKKRIKSAGGRGRNNPYDVFYWWWQEFGFTAVGRNRIRGGSRARAAARAELTRSGRGRKIPGKRFLQEAFAGHSPQALVIFQQRIAERIARANTGAKT